MQKKIKLSLLRAAKRIGLFWLCRLKYRKHTRVLCYHGFAYLDEHKFRPKLFMQPATFAKRLEWLAQSPYRVVSLDDVIEGKEARDNQVVLTMDDGWSGTFELVYDDLRHHQFPLMLYVTSYYAEKQIPVLNVALAYLLWKTTKTTLRLELPQLEFSKEYQLEDVDRSVIVREICSLIDQLDNSTERLDILLNIASSLDVNLKVEKNFMFRLLNIAELKALQEINVDLQLHTHRHCSPLETHSFDRELEDNREWLSQFKDIAELRHFCYPSGEYSPSHLPLLAEHGIKTATTTHTGLMAPFDDRLQIKRILDGEDVELIELEAELCGFRSLIRSLLQPGAH
jgi:peptidoglycan/xylan/chitin deacetylase (PgdA/CDA1 family)